jgi:hypothetical protein
MWDNMLMEIRKVMEHFTMVMGRYHMRVILKMVCLMGLEKLIVRMEKQLKQIGFKESINNLSKHEF